MDKIINVGDRVQDKITKLQGVAIARTEWLFGCVRVTIQPEGLDKDGKTKGSYTVDEVQCKVIKRKAFKNIKPNEPKKKKKPKYGPRDDPGRQADPSRE